MCVRFFTVRCLSPVTRWKSRGLVGAQPLARQDALPADVLRSLSPLRNVLNRFSQGRRELQKLVQQEQQLSKSRQGGGGQLVKRSSSRLTLAERTRIGLEKKERKLERLRQASMDEYTFAPKTNHTLKRQSRSGRVDSNPSMRPRARSKLHWNSTGRRMPTPRTDKLMQEKQNKVASPHSVVSSSSGTSSSSRIDELYRDGIRRRRAFTDKVSKNSQGVVRLVETFHIR